MLKKLRLKFIVLNMTTVAVVLTVVFSAICVINYQQSLQGVYERLDSSISRAADGDKGMMIGQDAAATAPDGTAPGPTGDAANVAGAADTRGADDAASMGDATDGAALEIGGKHGGSDPFIPVAVYTVGTDGIATAVSSPTATASLAEDVLTQAAAQVANAPDSTGNLDTLGLHYAKRQVEGTTYLAFADMSSTNSWQSLALTLAGVGIAALAVFFVISLFFSRWALKPVAQAWTQQQRFVADASHELKTPLTVILANTSIMLEHPERSVASQSQWVESTQAEAQAMQQLVGDLLLMARLDEGGTTPLHEQVDLTDLIEGDLLQFESVAFERNVTLSGNIDRNVSVQGDTTRLHRLATTLLDNACKYANDGGEVRVTLQQSIHHIELAVHNTGVPIAPEDLPHVFDRFYRADKARTHDEGSYGLGLAIARGIAEEHGGTITATSTEDAGTTFTVTLPIERA